MSFIIGLTGGIACGKSTIAKMFTERGINIFNADHYVHTLISAGGKAVPRIVEAFDDVLNEEGGIDRAKLSEIVFNDEVALAKLEAILHPLVHIGEERFIAEEREEYKPISVLEVPLLYETRADALCDMTIIADCSEPVQRSRAMMRPGMTAEKFEQIISRQLSRDVRNQKANLVINTEAEEEQTRKLVNELIDTLLD